MSAPTARIDKSTNPEPLVNNNTNPEDEDEEMLIDTNMQNQENDEDEEQKEDKNSKDVMTVDQDGKPRFDSVKNTTTRVKKEMRSISIPPHRYGPLKQVWATKIYEPIVKELKLQIKFVDKRRDKKVMLRTSQLTTDPSAMQRASDFLRGFALGFDVDDAIALLKLDDLYLETFEIKDVKTLTGDHLSRAIGRVAGKDGKTKFAIENTSRTRVVLADSKIHILGGYENIQIARRTIVDLILGKPPGKVYGNLRTISSRMKERY